MVQLIARPGRNAARQAKKAREIRHVKGAIVWHEKKRVARKELMKAQWEAKQTWMQRQKWEHENITQVKRKALRNAVEDWKLGSLRPNRAVNVADGKYAVVVPTQVQKPEIPTKIQARTNEAREKKGCAAEYPLVVDDKKYFPIVKGDRVVVTKGKEKGKIGIVMTVVPRTHEVIVTGINMAYYDSKIFNAGAQDIGPRRESEMPIAMDDVRLVVPYASTSFSRSGQSIYEDVIVDKVLFERHSTGIDPFTGTDYGNAEIPKQHQYDPETGLPIFHRYIAGTRYRIAWPWETETKAADSTLPTPNKKAAQGWLSTTLGTLRHPITTLQSWRNPTSKKPAKRAPSTLPLSTQVENIEASEARNQRRAVLRSEDPKHKDAHDVVDTTRNIVEGSDSMSYTLVAPPFPDTLSQELRGDVFEMTQTARHDTDAPYKPIRGKHVSPKAQAAQAFAQKKARAAERMKTPMQLRWEQEQAKKKLAKKEGPAVDTETLLAALGQHMSANGVKLTTKRRAASQVEELD
ncbi:hypothetical protein BU25DRAFT_412658 [Macroventuria anomochaeta]|uniref:Uncharacterized protein n=1 Tax=Macroventuria anomochaeta TaxID=301207 RepID=A0ACB6RV09_9PLEO|nr:uncharacterized protein BU25DRAFT_412658 [Macroventuria anomochaeta]KAF2625623.1 hypothetical protein BU25DRAFT_412658 [Macroventuria anomochaeta]